MTATDLVLVNVTDTTPPFILSPADFVVDYGVNGSYLNWTCSEPYPDFYRITRNASLVGQGNWNGSSLRVSLDGLDYGLHNYFLSVNDTHGNSASDTVRVTVIDYPSPTITPLDDDVLELGATGEYLNWTCDAYSPDYFIISHNGSTVSSGQWNGSYLVASLDGLDFGAHSFTIYINDTYGYDATDEVIINVVDNTPPVVDSPDDMSFDYGTTGESIVWTPSDLAPSTYTVYRNGSAVQSDSWDGSQVAMNLDGLSVGVYNFTLVVSDIGGNVGTDQVIITVSAGATTTTSSITSTTSTLTSTTGTPDPMLFIYVGIGGVVVVAVLVFLIMRSRVQKG